MSTCQRFVAWTPKQKLWTTNHFTRTMSRKNSPHFPFLSRKQDWKYSFPHINRKISTMLRPCCSMKRSRLIVRTRVKLRMKRIELDMKWWYAHCCALLALKPGPAQFPVAVLSPTLDIRLHQNWGLDIRLQGHRTFAYIKTKDWTFAYLEKKYWTFTY